jgi:hypothetical protein
LLGFCVALVGCFRGELGHVNVVASLIFSDMSGSAVADAAGIGKIIIQMMTISGHYTRGYSAAITAASATIGPSIPPSIPMVLCALVSNTSIGYLFLGGIILGLMMGAVLMGMNTDLSHRRGFTIEEPVPLSELPRRTANAFPALLMLAILLYGIYGGVTTPTEAASVAAFYALMLASLFYCALSFKALYSILVESVRSSAAVGLVIGGALILNYVVASENIPSIMAVHLVGLDVEPLAFLFGGHVVVVAFGVCVGCHNDHPGHHSTVFADVSRTWNRPRPFRSSRHRQLHDRFNYTAIWHPFVRSQCCHGDTVIRNYPRNLAILNRIVVGVVCTSVVARSGAVVALPIWLPWLRKRRRAHLYNMCENNYITSLVSRGGGVQLSS